MWVSGIIGLPAYKKRKSKRVDRRCPDAFLLKCSSRHHFQMSSLGSGFPLGKNASLLSCLMRSRIDYKGRNVEFSPPRSSRGRGRRDVRRRRHSIVSSGSVFRNQIPLVVDLGFQDCFFVVALHLARQRRQLWRRML